MLPQPQLTTMMDSAQAQKTSEVTPSTSLLVYLTAFRSLKTGPPGRWIKIRQYFPQKKPLPCPSRSRLRVRTPQYIPRSNPPCGEAELPVPDTPATSFAPQIMPYHTYSPFPVPIMRSYPNGGDAMGSLTAHLYPIPVHNRA
jgi:hypothetical protein